MHPLRLGLVLLALALAGCGVGDGAGGVGGSSSSVRPTPIEGGAYRLIAPDRISVGVVVGTCGRRGTGSVSVEEDAEQVRLTAGVAGFDPPGRDERCTLELAVQKVTVGLAEPLGDRPVVDSTDGAVLRGHAVSGS